MTKTNPNTTTIDPATATKPELTDFLKANDVTVEGGFSRAKIGTLRELAEAIGTNEPQEQAPTHTPEAEVALPAEKPAADPKLAKMGRDKLAKLARDEWKAVKAAREAGEQAPDTPHLNELNRRYQNGERAATAARSKGNGDGSRSKMETPRPELEDGIFAIQLRTAKVDQVVELALGNKVQRETPGWALYADDEAQELIDTLVTWASENRSKVYDSRLAQAIAVEILHDNPTATTSSKRAATVKLPVRLNEGGYEWDFTVKQDGTVTFQAEIGGKSVEGTARQVLAELPDDDES